MELKDLLKSYRESNLLSQCEFAKKIGITQTNYSFLENGLITKPQNRTLKRIAKVMKITPQELIEKIKE